MAHLRFVPIALAFAVTAGAQSIPGAVLARHEPHHHPVYEDATLRVLRVRVPAHDSTLLHEHDRDYFWIGLGASDVVNARLGEPDAAIHVADLSMHYTRGGFAHVARNSGAEPFDNITVELLGKQADVKNLCDAVVTDAPLTCASAGASTQAGAGSAASDAGTRSTQAGVAVRPSFETNRLRVSLVTLSSGASLRGNGGASWFITLQLADAPQLTLEARRMSRPDFRSPEWTGGVWRAARSGAWSVTNRAAEPLRLLEVTPRGR